MKSGDPSSARSATGHSALRAMTGKRVSGRLSQLEPFRLACRLFCYIDRDLGRPQWADVRMYLQTVMLLLRAEGLHSCPQMAWSQVRESVAEVLSPPENLILFCGMSIGYKDPQ
jgi:nitroreductase